MGSACCVAARDRSLPNRTGTGSETLHRNVTCSPSWSFRWDNRRRVAGEIEEPSYQVSNGASRNVSMEIKGTLSSDRGNLSDQGSPLEMENYGTPASQKSPVHEEMCGNMMTPPSDISRASNYSVEVKNLAESPDVVDSSTAKLSFSIPSSFSPPITDTLSSHGHLLPPSSTPSRRARRSPGHRLLRQISDSRILGLKSPNNYSMSEGRSSFVLSTCSNDLTAGSHGGSSDGWSMRTFSELVASSQRERWSFDSEHLGSGYGKISGCSSRFSYSPSIDSQTCGACSKLLAERSSFIASNEISVVAVLVCGHVYHAECLEMMTLEADKYDPACPICMVGEKQVSKMSRKALKAEAELKAKHLKLFKNRVIDSFVDGGCDDFGHQENAKREGKAPKLEPSSSRRSSLAKPFLKRHFSIGSKWGRSLSENDSARKKGFWARYRKD
ncbi:Zinc finger, RING-type [Corchorus olitorius]|uniref:Zinc finger, RING-type n=1 Tax=Corchorus olitorius TaxID=93759 RepID=A0A1R3HY23_9ROSI|nr:Zinc finger, RING-type [Corchorus olitorius]